MIIDKGTEFYQIKQYDWFYQNKHVFCSYRYHPTAEDIETYKKFKDRQAELENTDQFMLQLCEIPYLKTRLNVLMVVNEFPVQYDDIAPVRVTFVILLFHSQIIHLFVFFYSWFEVIVKGTRCLGSVELVFEKCL